MKFASSSLPLLMLTSFSASAQVTASGLRRRLNAYSTAVAMDENAPVMSATAGNATSPFKLPTKAPPNPATLHAEAAQLHRVWVQYKTDVTRSACLESLQSKVMASTGAPAADAKALLQAQGETVAAKSSSTTGPSRFCMHYDFFDTKLGSMVMTVDDAMLRSLQDDPTVQRIGKDVKRYPMVLKEATGQLANKGKHGSRNLQEELLPYGVSMVQADQVWNQGFKGQGVTVCVIDTGLDGKESLSRARTTKRFWICVFSPLCSQCSIPSLAPTGWASRPKPVIGSPTRALTVPTPVAPLLPGGTARAWSVLPRKRRSLHSKCSTTKARLLTHPVLLMRRCLARARARKSSP